MKKILVLAILILGVAFLPSNIAYGASSWQQIWGPAGTVVGYYDVIKGTSVIYATELSTGDIFRYDGTPFKWTKVGGPGKIFAVNSKGDLYGLSPDGKGVFQYTGTPGKWTQIGGPANGIYAGGDKLFATNPQTGDIAQYTGVPMNWTKVGGPGNMFAVDTKGILYGLSPDQKGIFQYSGTPGKWTQIGASSYRIYAGGEIYAIGQIAEEIFRYDGIPFKWTKIGGPGNMFAVSSKGDLYGLSADKKSVNQYTGTPWKWASIGGSAAAIYTGGEILLATSPGTNNLWAYLQQPIPQPPAQPSTTIKFYINSTAYYVNNTAKTMDAAPVIMESRTLLPIRYVAEALGASVDWKPDEQKVTITFGGKTVELWIGQNSAKVDGNYKLIDPDNPSVVPIIIPPGRTMLPLRFIAENLGCKVDWNDTLKEVTVTYPAS